MSHEDRALRSTTFEVSCPFKAGEGAWAISIKRHTKEPVLLSSPGGSYFSRWAHTLEFPRLKEKPDGAIEGDWDTIGERFSDMLEILGDLGFEDVTRTRWQFVHLVFLCQENGREHVLAAIPSSWPPGLLLNVTVSYEIE